ncbi:MAG TPA: hypothetical protein VFH54_10165 [Mycobacteriales bacterium]|nr:hypothetical protein [Mycobacteriales bacterium]
MPHPRPLHPAAVAELIAARADAVSADRRVRLVIDGPPWSGIRLGPLVVAALQDLPRPAVLVETVDYLRPASLRLERGRDDPEAFYEDWIDLAALRREVFEPAGPGGSGRVLPALWDAGRDRAVRAGYVTVPETAIVVVEGWFLLGAGLAHELAVHVSLTGAARQRRVPAADAARDLPAFARYDDEVRPLELADIVVRADDPRRPAVVVRDE